MTAHKELIERLRIVPTASQFLKVSDLFGELVDERAKAADALESQALEMEGLRRDAEQLDFVLNNGLPMERGGWYRYHECMECGWYPNRKDAIDAAMAAKGVP